LRNASTPPARLLTPPFLLERIRYLGQRTTPQDEQTLLSNWDCARIIITAHYNTSIPEGLRTNFELPFLHIIVQTTDIPLATIERALRRYKDQLALADAQGNLPLHYIAARLPSEDVDVLNDVLKGHPIAARITNLAGHLPLDLAIQAGRRFESGLQSLLMEFPDPINDLELSRSVFPLVLEEWFRTERTSLVYALIKANPDFVDKS
jgi:hypothetical protein